MSYIDPASSQRSFSHREQESQERQQGHERGGPVAPAASHKRAPYQSSQSSGYENTSGVPATFDQTHRSAPSPSKAATGGQSRSHRPVSAMPTPVSYSQRSSMVQTGGTDGGVPNMAGPYNDRRASAHPTLPTASQTVQGLAQMALSPSIDANMASSAITSGIPITSQAAMQYFAAHPRRQQVHFGSYLLLQTLGEGEFGKVKLGVHKEWGEEVAVKLIKRDKVGGENGQLSIGAGSAVKDPAKMSKVEREIQVLKEMRHPNIVRLYEVIESDRYIGIVLEYASGGELFDHILAHKYLKDRDACRLFAQLISGVNYLHQKKVVHRDLKLENLLLDRNRNVIITDFGFANNFEDRQDDLMATSCGSPCYAAPELVVQDGLYNGSAVDVWSCGVILYAMLAGYLPFDDDPANPEGDNINLLYKYIMATPLSFPEYITPEPRDLLSKMLVPDPVHRIDLHGVMTHSWLAPYRELFKFTVDELERAAVEQQTKKRHIYRQQMELQHQMRERQRQEAASAAALQSSDSRNRSIAGDTAGIPSSSASMASGLVPQSIKAQRHQSATATPTYANRSTHTSMDPPQSIPMPLSDTTNRVQDPVVAQGNVRGEPRAKRDEGDLVETLEDDNFPLVGEYKKGPAASKPQRHTIQLEYDGGSAAAARWDVSITSTRPTTTQPIQEVDVDRSPAGDSGLHLGPSASADAPTVVPAVSVFVPEAEKKTSGKSSTTSLHLADQQSSAAVRVDKSIDYQQPSTRQQTSRSASKSSVNPPLAAPTQRRESSSKVPSASSSGPTSLPAPQQDSSGEAPSPIPAQQHKGSTDTSVKSRAMCQSLTEVSHKTSLERSNSSRRHQRGISTDKFFLSRLLGNSNVPTSTTNESEARNSNTSSAASPAMQAINADRAMEGSNLGRSGSSRRKAMSLVIGGARSGSDPAAKDRERAIAATSKSSRGTQEEPSKATVGGSDPSASRRATTVPGGSVSSRPATTAGATGKTSTRPFTQQGPPASASSRFASGMNGRNDSFFERKTNDSSSTVGPSSSAAKKVMDWFRRKSLGKGVFQTEQPPLAPLDTRKGQKESTPAVATSKARPTAGFTVNATEAPRLTVTEADREVGGATSTAHAPTPSDGGPSSRSTSGAYSNVSHSSTATGLTSATESSYVNVNGAMLPPSTPISKINAQSTSTPTQQTTPRASYTAPIRSFTATPLFNDTLLRYHVGAVDQSALTSRPPPEVFAEVCRALFEMGIETKKEAHEEFKLECVRRRKPTKSLIGATQGLGTSLRSSVFPPTQADYERQASSLARSPNSSGLASTSAGAGGPLGSPTLSPSSSSIRNFLRRGSQTASPTFTTVALPESFSSTAMDQSISQQSTASMTHRISPSSLPPTLYGEARLDGGQEVRFSVEVTRIKNLAGLYSLDVRRLRGPLTSYKFLYHNVLKRVTDPGIDQ